MTQVRFVDSILLDRSVRLRGPLHARRLSALVLLFGGLIGSPMGFSRVALAQTPAAAPTPPAGPATANPQSDAAPVASTAAAPTRDPAAGEALFREGRRLLKAGDAKAACAKFAESQRLDPAPGTLANLADCEEQAGRTATAWVLWRRVVDETGGQTANRDPRQRTARKRAEALEKRLARLSIRLSDEAPPTLVVKRDDVILGAASLGLALPVDPGIHVVTTSAAGHQDAQFVIESREGEAKELEVSAGAPLPLAVPTAVATSRRPTVDASLAIANESAGPSVATVPAPPPRATGTRRLVGYALTATGVVAVAAGGYFSWQARQARTQAGTSCGGDTSPPLCWGSAQSALDRDARASRLADVGFASGAIAGLIGVYLISTQGNDAERATSQEGSGGGLAVVAGPRRGGAEVQLAATF